MTETEDNRPAGRELTGRKVLMIFIAVFGVIIGVNVFMAVNAVRTFPGLEVSSSYADSQDFNVRRDAQEALGWTAEVELDPEAGVLLLHLLDADGQPARPAALEALLTRPTNQTDDQLLDLVLTGGAYVAPADLAPGRWRLRLTGESSDGTAYRHNITFTVRS